MTPQRHLLLALCLAPMAACNDPEEAAHGDTSSDAVDAVETDTLAPDAIESEVEIAAPTPRCSTEAMGPAWKVDALAEDGPFFAGYLELMVTDPDRVTAAHGIYPESSGRTIAMRVWYPAKKGLLGDLTPQLLAELARDEGPFPLLVHSHGFSSSKDEISYAAEWLATRGWIVAQLEFPLTNLGTVGGPQLEDVVNQPADVGFAIDELLARNALSQSTLFGGIDEDRIALSGVSLGGLTTLLATYHRDWHDPRVKAAIDIAGPTGFFNETFYSFVPLPALLIHGDTDAIVDYAAHALPARERAPAGTLLVTLEDASHTGFAGAASLFESMDNPDSVGCGAIEGQLPDNDAFLRRMIDADIGIEAVTLPNPCELDPLPKAMRPSRQMLLTRLAMFAWLELQLGEDATRRATACAFLDTLDALEDVTLD